MSTLVYLVGEGSNDIGGLAREPEYQTADDGFFQPVIRQLSGRDLVFKGAQLKTLGREKVKGLADAWSRKAAQARAVVEYERADIVVVAADVDSSQGERATVLRREGDLTRSAARFKRGLSPWRGPPAVAATPCRTIEAWGLADTNAVCAVANVETVALEKPPEQLWGKPNDPQSNHPKCALTKIFGGSVDTSHYAALGAAARVDVLEAQCPMSFAPFSASLRAAFAAAEGDGV